MSPWDVLLWAAVAFFVLVILPIISWSAFVDTQQKNRIRREVAEQKIAEIRGGGRVNITNVFSDKDA